MNGLKTFKKSREEFKKAMDESFGKVEAYFARGRKIASNSSGRAGWRCS